MQRLRYAGLAVEPAFGDGPVPADVHVDIASASLDTPDEAVIYYEGGLGRGRNVSRPGYYHPEGDVVWAVDVRTIALALRAALGGYAFGDSAGDNGLSRHHLWASDDADLPSLTVELGKDAFEHIFDGCVVDEFVLEVEDEFATVTLELIGRKDRKGTIKAVTDLSLPDEYPLAFVDSTIAINGTDESAKLKSYTLTIANNIATDAGQRHGTRFPARLEATEREIGLEAELEFVDSEHLERVWGSSEGPSEEGPAEVELELALDGGADGSATIELPRTLVHTVEAEVSGRDEVEQTITAAALVDTLTIDGDEVRTDVYARVDNDQGGLA